MAPATVVIFPWNTYWLGWIRGYFRLPREAVEPLRGWDRRQMIGFKGLGTELENGRRGNMSRIRTCGQAVPSIPDDLILNLTLPGYDTTTRRTFFRMDITLHCVVVSNLTFISRYRWPMDTSPLGIHPFVFGELHRQLPSCILGTGL